MLSSTILFASMLVAPLGQGNAPVSIAWSGTQDGNASLQRTTVSCSAAFPGGGVVTACTVSQYFNNYPYMDWVDMAVDVVRWSGTGQKLWTYRLPGPTTARAIAIGDDGSIFLGVRGDVAYHVFKLDSNGTELWQNSIGGVGALEALALSPNGDIVVAGEVGPYATQDMLVAAFGADATFLWSTTIDGPLSGTDTVSNLACDVLGNIVVSGVFGHPGGLDRGVAKLDANGQVLWSRSVVDSTPYPRGMALAPDGGVLLGAAHYLGGAIYVTRLDGSGTTSWQRDWSNADHGDVDVADVRIAPDGVIWALVSSEQNSYPYPVHVALLRYDSGGALLSEYAHDLGQSVLEIPVALVPGAAGQYWAAASLWFNSSPQHSEAEVIQFDGSGASDWIYAADTDASNMHEWMNGAVLAAGDQLVLSGATNNNQAVGDKGYVVALDLSETPQGYCTAKVNSQGCEPSIAFAGNSSATATSGFIVSAANELNQKTGMLLYSVVGAASTPFQGGILCLHSPLKRTPTQSSGGSPPTIHDCSGSYALDMNAFAHGALGGNPDPSLLVPGTTVWCQAWGRDPGFALPDNTSLSNGLRFVVQP
jgi:hypothetical protein